MSRVLFTSPPSGQDTRSRDPSSSYTADAWEAFKKTVEPLKPSQRHGRAQNWNKGTGGTAPGMVPGTASASLNADTVRRAIRSGKFRPHATLDLHGMTCEEARVRTKHLFRAGSDQTMADVPHHHGQGRRCSESFFFRNVAPDDALQRPHSGGGASSPPTGWPGSVVRFFETASQDRAPPDGRENKCRIGPQMRFGTDVLADRPGQGPNLDERPRALVPLFSRARFRT